MTYVTWSPRQKAAITEPKIFGFITPRKRIVKKSRVALTIKTSFSVKKTVKNLVRTKKTLNWKNIRVSWIDF